MYGHLWRTCIRLTSLSPFFLLGFLLFFKKEVSPTLLSFFLSSSRSSLSLLPLTKRRYRYLYICRIHLCILSFSRSSAWMVKKSLSWDFPLHCLLSCFSSRLFLRSPKESAPQLEREEPPAQDSTAAHDLLTFLLLLSLSVLTIFLSRKEESGTEREQKVSRLSQHHR